jgi:hypothetical protein
MIMNSGNPAESICIKLYPGSGTLVPDIVDKIPDLKSDQSATLVERVMKRFVSASL